jgi:hypothetical protein
MSEEKKLEADLKEKQKLLENYLIRATEEGKISLYDDKKNLNPDIRLHIGRGKLLPSIPQPYVDPLLEPDKEWRIKREKRYTEVEIKDLQNKIFTFLEVFKKFEQEKSSLDDSQKLKQLLDLNNRWEDVTQSRGFAHASKYDHAIFKNIAEKVQSDKKAEVEKTMEETKQFLGDATKKIKPEPQKWISAKPSALAQPRKESAESSSEESSDKKQEISPSRMMPRK